VKPLLIGQAPSRSGGEGEYALFPYPPGSAGHRLWKLMGVSRGQYMRHFDRVNLLSKYPGDGEAGDLFPQAAAMVAADDMIASLEGRRVVFVGVQVAAAFEFTYPVLMWRRHRGFEAVSMPHTSGRARWWNEAGNWELAERFLTDFAVSVCS